MELQNYTSYVEMGNNPSYFRMHFIETFQKNVKRIATNIERTAAQAR